MIRHHALTAASLVLLGLAVAPLEIRGAPRHVRLSFMEDASTSVGLAWNTSTGPVEASVEYGTVKGSYTHSGSGIIRPMDLPLGPVSEIVLTGLTPATVYHFRVGGPNGGFSPDATFRTAPSPHPQCGTFSFVVVGDSRGEAWQGDQGTSNLWPNLVVQAMAHAPAFLLHGGDIVHDGNRLKQWDNHMMATSPVSSSVPIMYARGNHDDGPATGDGANYNRIFLLPGGSGTEDHYHFTYGNAIFVVISTESYSGGSPPFSNQAVWMDTVLTQNPRLWKFVVLHRPIYTDYLLVNHKPNEVGQNAALVPVLTKHHVDMVFQSHNHFYERFVPSRCTDGASTTPCPAGSFGQGTVHITTGGGGAFPILFPGLTNSVRPVATSLHHYLLLEIVHGRLEMKVYNLNGMVIDSLTVNKDTGSSAPCAGGNGPAEDASGRDVTASPVDSPLDLLTPSDSTGGNPPLSEAGDGCSCDMGTTPAHPALFPVIILLFTPLLSRRNKKS